MALEQRCYVGEIGDYEVTVTLYEEGDQILQWEFDVDGDPETYQSLAERFGARIIRAFVREAGLHAR
jgi:hypothetical protein